MPSALCDKGTGTGHYFPVDNSAPIVGIVSDIHVLPKKMIVVLSTKAATVDTII